MKLKKRYKSLFILAGIIIVIIVVTVISVNAKNQNSEQGTPEGGPNLIVTGGTEPGSYNGGDENNGIETLWYYNSGLASRYEAFRMKNPDFTDDEICWMVGCDLDLIPYEDISAVPDPYSILLNVNKYYYLPEDYTPNDLISIGKTMMRKEAGEAMLEMIAAAEEEGHVLWSQSGFRSYGIQVQLFNDYSARDGVEAAETYSARPGHSEHQTGLTTDLNTITDAFGETSEGIWAAENCWKFGFIVRYTRENTNITLYRPEPWHMRYIGREDAKIMHDERMSSFEEYWVKYVKNTPF